MLEFRNSPKPPARSLAGFSQEPDWTDTKNIQKLRMYRAAPFIDCKQGVADIPSFSRSAPVGLDKSRDEALNIAHDEMWLA